MKKKWNEKYISISLYVFFTAAAIAAFVLLLSNLKQVIDIFGRIIQILSPFIWAAVLAYLFHRPICFFEKHLFKKTRAPYTRKILSLATVYFLFAGILFAVVCIILPQLIDSVAKLIKRIPEYYRSLINALSHIFGNTVSLPDADWKSVTSSMLERIGPMYAELTTMGIDFIIGIFGGIMNAFIALVGSIYILLSGGKFTSQIKKLFYAILPNKFMDKLVRITRETSCVFSAFIYAKISTSLLVGFLTFLTLIITNTPYALLIGTIMVLFNLIPFFGPIIGAIPSTILMLLIDPVYALIFIIATVVLQFLDGQIFTPKLLGSSLGISPFWVLFSIIVFGGIAGIPGMLLGVPIFSIIYTLLKEFADHRLKSKGLSTNATDYKSDKAGKS